MSSFLQNTLIQLFQRGGGGGGGMFEAFSVTCNITHKSFSASEQLIEINAGIDHPANRIWRIKVRVLLVLKLIVNFNKQHELLISQRFLNL